MVSKRYYSQKKTLRVYIRDAPEKNGDDVLK
jgi:hypothetical protein